ncbi:mannose-6-phosphate isomerase [Hydrogenispora ethanolica]|uniref:Mannose-6-phosphate isomerase n=1 Tax=Hydrogenispora ethanolica TaxID=1082276 RepID=A0A4R1R8B1_HYDET|nr:class I mannose-6-phosphate isomerase [Hydrogenispora ethanolica]TCL61876.1 mannose-6-phosphate isomerase [Hydrogenispora ethanolica]
MRQHDWAHQPLRLQMNRVRRPFRGGLLLDRWQGRPDPRDDFQAEEWVASTLAARNPQPIPEEGVSRVLPAEGPALPLPELIGEAPELFLGAAHVRKHGPQPAVLVKVLDSCSRLMLQVHPDRDFARAELNSAFGKTEAWHILGGRAIDGVEPYVLLGFKPGITRAVWQDLFERQDVEGMVDALHRFPVKAGQTFLVEGGVPHAAGPGCCFMEIQEPTDFTMRVERIGPSGARLSDEQLHQGIGFQKMLDCFRYEGLSEAETLRRWRLVPEIARCAPGGRIRQLLTYQDTPFFAMNRLEIWGRLELPAEERFSVAVVWQGSGVLHWHGGTLPVGPAAELFLPAAVGPVVWEADPGQTLDVIHCLPPL